MMVFIDLLLMLQEKVWNILERCFQKKEKYVLLINISILYVGVVYWENLIGNFEKESCSDTWLFLYCEWN